MEENNTIDRTAKLYEALSQAQGDMTPPVKNAAAHFGKYANLASILNAIREPFKKYGLSVTQRVTENSLVTMICHKSGGEITSKLPLPDPNKMKIQEYGKLLTYSRRYSLAAICGIEGDEENDPDNPAIDNKETHDEPPGGHGHLAPKDPKQELSDAQLKRLYAISMKHNVDKDVVQNYIKSRFKKNSSKELNRQEYDQLCEWLQDVNEPKF